jgi:hypothetical protein
MEFSKYKFKPEYQLVALAFQGCVMKNVFTDLAGVAHTWETPDVHTPLDTLGVMATLNAVLGIWSLQDAANAVGLTPDDLVHEAQAWAAAAVE